MLDTLDRIENGKEPNVISQYKCVSTVAVNSDKEILVSKRSALNNYASISNSIALSDKVDESVQNNSQFGSDKMRNENPTQSNYSANKAVHAASFKDRCLNRRKSSSFRDRTRQNKEEISPVEKTWLDTQFDARAKEFLNSAGLFSINKLLSISTTILSRKYKQWRLMHNYQHLPSTTSTVARWQGLARIYKFENGSDSARPSESFNKNKDTLMYEVRHLTKTIVGGGDLPIKYITVMSCDGECTKIVIGLIMSIPNTKIFYFYQRHCLSFESTSANQKFPIQGMELS